jgi:hypothetical protein
MKKLPMIALIALAVAGPALAGSSRALDELAEQSGLRERELRMLAGAPSAFAEYRTSYRELARKAKARGLDLRSQAVLERHARELDRAVAFSMKVDSRRLRSDSIAAR